MAVRLCGLNLYRHRVQYVVLALVLCTLLYWLYIRSSSSFIVTRKPLDGLNSHTHVHGKGIDNPHDVKEIEPKKETQDKDTAQLRTVGPRKEAAKVLTFTGPENERQKAVVEAMKHAWSGYVRHAWGHDELKPLSKGPYNWMNLGLTIVDSLDTLYMMNLQDEYKLARNWVDKNLTFARGHDVLLFEVVIRELGGLLTAYHLTNDKLFLEKATDLGNRLVPCLTGPHGIPCTRINLESLSPQFYDISSAESGTIQLELVDLSRSLQVHKYETLARTISDKLHAMPGKLDGLVPNFIDALKGVFKRADISVGASGDSYYEYLLKQWIQTGKTQNRQNFDSMFHVDDLCDRFRDDYLEAVEGMKKRLLRYTEPNHYAYMGQLYADQVTFRSQMEHLACFLPGTLALGAMNGLDSSHLDLAANLTRTCYEMYAAMPTGLSPEIASMSTSKGSKKDVGVIFNSRYNAQRPETVESLFYLYRATGQEKYREWGWKIFQSFEKWTKVEGGYCSIENVDALVPNRLPMKRDKMESFYLAETLKYFYLLFADKELIPLDSYVFNTEAHPLPIYVNSPSSSA